MAPCLIEGSRHNVLVLDVEGDVYDDGLDLFPIDLAALVVPKGPPFRLQRILSEVVYFGTCRGIEVQLAPLAKVLCWRAVQTVQLGAQLMVLMHFVVKSYRLMARAHTLKQMRPLHEGFINKSLAEQSSKQSYVARVCVCEGIWGCLPRGRGVLENLFDGFVNKRQLRFLASCELGCWHPERLAPVKRKLNAECAYHSSQVAQTEYVS
jgi:hypothetical protein